MKKFLKLTVHPSAIVAADLGTDRQDIYINPDKIISVGSIKGITRVRIGNGLEDFFPVAEDCSLVVSMIETNL